jgi:threonine/homoserine/homoserine lactone efflux protein
MGQAIGQILPTALGVAISPLPIVAVVLMLVTPRGRVNGLAFVAGWCAGLAVVGVIVISVAGGVGATDDGAPATWLNWLKLLLGVLLLLVAARQWKARPVGSDEPATPKWMGALEGFTPLKALGAGAALAAANPKNLLLAAAGAAVVAQAELSTGQETVTWLIFIVLATIGVAAPVVIALAMGGGSRDLLDRLKNWLAHNNTLIMAVLLLVIGVKLIGDAISGFSA